MIIMCRKLPYCNPRIDKCLISRIEKINEKNNLKTLASCCGHGKYNPTIVVKDKLGKIYEFYSEIILIKKKRNRYYKKDNNGFYYVPEVVNQLKIKKIN